MLRILSIFALSFLINSCLINKSVTTTLGSELSLEAGKIMGLEVSSSYTIIKDISSADKKKIIEGILKAERVGPHKFRKLCQINLIDESGKEFAFDSDGVIHLGNIGYFKTEENILEQFIIHTDSMSFESRLNGQVAIVVQQEIAQKLAELMDKKEYDAAIELFSKEQQKNILELRKDPNLFSYWIQAWTFDEAKLNRYIIKIKEGKAHFLQEDGTWKINEK